MIEAYKIAVNMTLTGDAHKRMMEFSRLIEKASRDMDVFLRHLKGVDTTFGVFNREVRTGTSAMRQFDASLLHFGRDVNRVKGQVDSLRNSIRSLNVAGRAAGGAAGIGGGGGAIGIGMGAAIGRFAGGYLSAAAMMYGGYNLEKASFKQRAEYTGGVAKLEAMGYSPADIELAKQMTGTGRLGIAPSTQMNAYVAAAMATQNPERARKLMPALATGMLSAERLYGGMSQHQVEHAIRAAEIMGGSDEAKISERLGDVFKMVALSGGTIMPSQIRQLVRKNPNLSTAGLLALEPVVQELGGDVTATGLRTGQAQLIKGQMGKAQAESLKSYGILGAVRLDKNGRPIGSKYGDLKEEYREMAFADPTRFLTDVILPAYKKKGITSSADIQKHLYFDFARTYADVLNVVYKNLGKSNEIRARMNVLPGLQGLAGMGSKEAVAAQRFTEAWKTFEDALGKFSSPAIVGGLNLLSKLLVDLSSFMQRFSEGGKPVSFIPGMDKWGATSSTAKNNAQAIKGDVYLDGKKMGMWSTKNMLINTMVQDGTSASNPAYSGASNAWTGNDGTFSQ